MPLTDKEKQAAAEHLTEMVGAAIGVALLAADDYPHTKTLLHKAIDDFPAEMRDVLTKDQKSHLLAENTRIVRWHSRELYRTLDSLIPEETPDDLGTPEQDQNGSASA